MSRYFALTLIAAGAAACSNHGVGTLNYKVTETCTTTTTCTNGSTNVKIYSFDATGPSDSDSVSCDGGMSMFENPLGDGGSGTGGGKDGGGSTGGYTDGGTGGYKDGGSTGGYTDGGTGGYTDGGTGGTPPGCTETTTCVPSCEGEGCDGSQPPASGGCWVTGGGFIVDGNGHDSFGGNGMPMKDGRVRGQWQHVDHGSGRKSHGQVAYVVCRHVDEPGPGQPSGPSKMFNLNQAYFGGPARFFTQSGGWATDFWFDVFAEDHGEPGNKPGPMKHGGAGPDFYQFTLRKLAGANQSGPVVYQTSGNFVGGNFQIHPSNNGHPFKGGTLPSWVSFQQ